MVDGVCVMCACVCVCAHVRVCVCVCVCVAVLLALSFEHILTCCGGWYLCGGGRVGGTSFQGSHGRVRLCVSVHRCKNVFHCTTNPHKNSKANAI